MRRVHLIGLNSFFDILRINPFILIGRVIRFTIGKLTRKFLIYKVSAPYQRSLELQ